MRRAALIAVLSVVVPSLLTPTSPAGAVTAGACAWDAAVAYQQGLAPIVPPTTGASALAMQMNLGCVGVGTSTWQLTGTGSASGSCASEISSADLQDGGGAVGRVTWVRAGVYGWLFLTVATPGGPSSAYTFDGPLAWRPSGPDECLTVAIGQASMVGLARNVGV